MRSNDSIMKLELGLVLTSPNTGTMDIVFQKYFPSTVLIGMCLSGFSISVHPILFVNQSSMSCPLLPVSRIA